MRPTSTPRATTRCVGTRTPPRPCLLYTSPNFGNDGYTVAENKVTYKTETVGDGADAEEVQVVDTVDDPAYAEGLTTIIPNEMCIRDSNKVVTFGPYSLLPGESVTVTASYYLRTVKTIAHHAIISGGEEGDIETNTVSYKVKRDLDKLVPVLPLYQSSMLTATQLVNRETDESGAIKVVSQRTPTSTVGNYTGMTYLAAKAAIEGAGLTLGRVTFTTDASVLAAAGIATPPAFGTVVGQTPGAGLVRFGSQDNLVDPNIKKDDAGND